MNTKKIAVSAMLLSLASWQSHAEMVTPLASDLFAGATVTGGDAAVSSGAFDGTTDENNSETGTWGVAFFHDSATTSRLYFETAADVTLGGVRLFASNDGPSLGYDRSMNAFRFFVDADNNGVYETELVNQSIDHRYLNTLSYNESDVSSSLIMTFDFASSITASKFLVEMEQGTPNETYPGIRLNELDGLEVSVTDVSAPYSMAMIALGLVGLVGRRKRNSAHAAK